MTLPRDHRILLTLLALTTLALLSACAGSRGSARMEKQASDMVKGSRTEGADVNFRPGPKFSEELREKIAAENWVLEGKDRQIPLTLNEEVQAGIEYFLNDARRFMVNALGRSTKYLPMFQSVLKKKGLPPDLAYLVLIESGFRVDAMSPAAAGGLWQFIPATGRRYGLKVNDWVDERMSPEKATRAAADYLADLHDMFGSWPLAAAAYNCGEGKIQAGLARYNLHSYWELSSQPGFLPEETRRYVPMFLAAVIIAKDPERFGLTGIQYEKPEDCDVIEVATPTDLDVIAKLAGTDLGTIQALNPHIKLWCTPLDEHNYPVRLPRGTGEAFRNKYAQLAPEDRRKTSYHLVQSGENLKTIAALYQLSPLTLQQYNGLKTLTVARGQKIRLPVDATVYQTRQKEYQARQVVEQQKLQTTSQRLVYKVKPGDNVFQVAKRYDVAVHEIITWNKIPDVTKVQAGDELVLYLRPLPTGTAAQTRKDLKPAPATQAAAIQTKQDVKPPAAKDKIQPQKEERTSPTTYTVKSGDTIADLAAKHHVGTEQLMAANNLRSPQIQPGQVLKISGTEPIKTPPHNTAPKDEPAKTAVRDAGPAKTGSHTVQSGETMYSLAVKYKVGIEDLRAANNMKGNDLKPGQNLKIPGSAVLAQAASKPPDKLSTSAKPATTTVAVTDKKATSKPVAYTIQNGDTVWKIAQRFKVDPERIRQWNGMKNDSLQPGKVLTIKSEAN